MTRPPLPPLPDRPLSICIVGAGAIGGGMAAQLALAGEAAGIGEVSVIARGPHLKAMQDHGLRIVTADHPEERVIKVRATDDPDSLPPQDLVVTALKGHQIPPMADALARLMAPHGRIISVVNGVPWWYPISDDKGGTRGAEEVDPGGVLWKAIGRERAIGAIAFFSAFVPEPGLVNVNRPGFIDLGRMPGEDRADVVRVAEIFRAAGLDIHETQPFHNALWTKIMSNCAMNSVCALARVPTDVMLNDPVLSRFAIDIMAEVHATGTAEHAEFPYTAEERAADARETLAVVPSTLQDLDAGRPMEIEPIFGATITVAKSHGIPCPNLELATTLLRNIDKAAGH